MQPKQLLRSAQRLQALAQAGLEYAVNNYDRERYEEIRNLSAILLNELTDEPMEKILAVFATDKGYQTPKVDIRAVVFRGSDEILLVSETIDGGRWTLPGGWADVGYTPTEVAVKEAEEESGLTVRAVRLLGVIDKREHAHPPDVWYVYKLFIRCEVVGGSLRQQTAETQGARWFLRNELRELPLSTGRVTLDQLERLFTFAQDPDAPAFCD